MTKRKNCIKLLAFFILSIIIFFLLNRFINNDIVNDNDFHYNMISVASIIGGFLFTGLGVLISAIDKERIKRLWDNNYLDDLYRFSIIGIFCNIITVFIALFIICINFDEIDEKKKIIKIMTSVEITTIICGLIGFIISMIYLSSIIRKLKSQN